MTEKMTDTTIDIDLDDYADLDDYYEGKALIDAEFQLRRDAHERLSAWERPIDGTGWTIVITDSTGLSHKRGMGGGFDDPWLVGLVYDKGGEKFREPTQCETVTEALDEAQRLYQQIVEEVAEADAARFIAGLKAEVEQAHQARRAKREPEQSTIWVDEELPSYVVDAEDAEVTFHVYANFPKYGWTLALKTPDQNEAEARARLAKKDGTDARVDIVAAEPISEEQRSRIDQERIRINERIDNDVRAHFADEARLAAKAAEQAEMEARFGGWRGAAREKERIRKAALTPAQRRAEMWFNVREFALVLVILVVGFPVAGLIVGGLLTLLTSGGGYSDPDACFGTLGC